MRHRYYTWLFSLLTILALFFLSACSSSGRSSANPIRPAVTNEQTASDWQSLLPTPGQLATGQQQPRRTTAVEEDYINHGADFEAALAHRNVLSAPGQAAEFQPSWSEASGMDPSHLALCIYKFTIADFDRAPELRYGWSNEPADARSVWFAFSDWQADAWLWRRGEGDRVIGFSSLDPFFSTADTLYVVVLCASDDISVLRYLRLGEMPAASVQLTVTPRYARPSATIGGDASASTMPVGTIESYEWDWDRDGLFEEDTDDNPHSYAVFDEVGDHEFAVRVTSSYGEQAVGTATFTIIDAWTHSWGPELTEGLSALVSDGSEYFYAAGSTMNSGDNSNALLLKYRLDGELQWAAGWGGEDYVELTDVKYSNGEIFTVGATTGYGSGGYDVLIQRWDEDGEVLWSRVWGTNSTDRGNGLALTDSAIYVAGYTEAMGSRDVLLLKYDLDGNFGWARTWGDQYIDFGTDIAASYQFASEDYNLFATGATSSSDSVWRDVLYLRFDEDAGFSAQQYWQGHNQNIQRGNAIVVSGLVTKDVFIAGSSGIEPNMESILVEVGSGPGYPSRGLQGLDNYTANDILRLGDRLYLACQQWDYVDVSAACLLELPLSGTTGRKVTFWEDGDLHTTGTALCSIPGNGVLVGGNCQAADLGSWSDGPFDLLERTGTWTDHEAQINVPIGTEEAPTAAAQLISGGVIDTGGGDTDALLSVVQ